MDARSTSKQARGPQRRREHDVNRQSQKRSGLKENPNKQLKEALKLAKTTEQALRNTNILNRERKAAQAQKLLEDRPTHLLENRVQNGPSSFPECAPDRSPVKTQIPGKLDRRLSAAEEVSVSQTAGLAETIIRTPFQDRKAPSQAANLEAVALVSHALQEDLLFDSPQTSDMKEVIHEPLSYGSAELENCTTSTLSSVLAKKRERLAVASPVPQQMSPGQTINNLASSSTHLEMSRRPQRLDAVALMLRADSVSPARQSCSQGERRFLSSLLELKAGASREQRDHARAQREVLLRDLEEQVRLKREEKQARLAAERAAEEKEDAKLREYYAKFATPTQSAFGHAAAQSPGDTQNRVTFAVPADVGKFSRYEVEEPASSHCTSNAIESPSTSPVPLSDGCTPSQEVNKDIREAFLNGDCARALPLTIPVLDRTSPGDAENRMDQLLQQLRAEQAALKEQCAKHAMALEELKSKQPARERHSEPLLSGLAMQDGDELQCSSELVELQLNHIPESAAEIPYYSGPVQVSRTECLTSEDEGVPIAALGRSQIGSSSEGMKGARSVKEHKERDKNPMASSCFLAQTCTSSVGLNMKRDQRGRDTNLRVPLVRRAWAR